MYNNIIINMLSIIKILAYQQGVFVPDYLYEELEKTAYNGYRTTSGVFMKFGGTMTFEDFNKSPKAKIMTYEEYLKEREWVTAQIFKVSDMDKSSRDSYLQLDFDDDGNLVVFGVYIDKEGKRHKIYLNDVGFFKQGNYDDSEAVAVQAGGIRARVSPCGTNCISGCKFCTFGSGAKNYKSGQLSGEKLENYIKPLIRNVVNDHGITQIFFTGGNPSIEDMKDWTIYIKEGIREFKNEAAKQGIPSEKLAVDVMLTPRGEEAYVYEDRMVRKQKYKEYCEILKSYGVDTVSPNMELWTQEKLDLYCPGRGDGTTKSEIGQEGYVDFLDAAVEVFGPFKVRTALIVGLNSIEETMQAIDFLVSRGILVTLSPFKAPEVIQTDLRYSQSLADKEAKAEDLILLSQYLQQKIEEKLSTMNEQERRVCEQNINLSLNAHNTHNTANLCSQQDLDRLEREHLENGRDYSLVRNAKSLRQILTMTNTNV